MEVIIRSLCCGASASFGGRKDRAIPAWAKQNAQHNPGCPSQRPDHTVIVHQDNQEAYTCYTILAFPTYTKD